MLRLTKKTEYGIIAMKYLITRNATSPESVVSRSEIAERFHIPKELLGKVLQKLGRKGLIRSYQGVSGGYVLSKDPDDISLYEVVEAIEGPIAMVECYTDNGEECTQLDYCNIQSPILSIRRNLTEYFESITLADL